MNSDQAQSPGRSKPRIHCPLLLEQEVFTQLDFINVYTNLQNIGEMIKNVVIMGSQGFEDVLYTACVILRVWGHRDLRLSYTLRDFQSAGS